MVSAWDCLHFATLELVRSTPVKQRLIAAYRRHLAVLPEDQLPGEARDAFKHVMVALQGVAPMRGEDAVAASVRKMSNQEADDCATGVVEIFGLVSRHLQAAGRPSAAVVQLHASDAEQEIDTGSDFAAALLSRA